MTGEGTFSYFSDHLQMEEPVLLTKGKWNCLVIQEGKIIENKFLEDAPEYFPMLNLELHGTLDIHDYPETPKE